LAIDDGIDDLSGSMLYSPKAKAQMAEDAAYFESLKNRTGL